MRVRLKAYFSFCAGTFYNNIVLSEPPSKAPLIPGLKDGEVIIQVPNRPSDIGQEHFIYIYFRNNQKKKKKNRSRVPPQWGPSLPAFHATPMNNRIDFSPTHLVDAPCPGRGNLLSSKCHTNHEQTEIPIIEESRRVPGRWVARHGCEDLGALSIGSI